VKALVYLRLGRVSNLPTVWTNVLAAAVLSGVPLVAPSLALLVVALSLFYIAGMYLNDAFDRHIDARERRERPIPSGQIGPEAVFALGFGMLGGASLMLLAAAPAAGPRPNWSSFGSGLVLAATITYYDVRHKRDRWSPVVMGLCRVLVYLTTALAVAGRVAPAVAGGALALLSYLIGLTYVAKQETLREYRNAWPLVFLFAPFVYGLPALGQGALAAAIYLGFLGWTCYAISFLLRRRATNIPRAVISFIAGICLLDALLIAGAGQSAMAVAAVGGFGLTLALQRYVRGT
jgi:heme O synthase-like polyprenyltransferase